MSIRLASVQRYSNQRVNRINLPVYAVTPNATAVSEPGVISYTVNAFYVPNNTVLYWTLEGTEVNDLSGNIVSGNVTVNNFVSSFTISTFQDFLTEGSQSIVARLRINSINGDIVATAPAVTILDTSITPTFVITPSAVNINEGSNVTFSISSTNIPDGTVLYWTNGGTTTGADFVGGANFGTFTVTSNSSSVTLNVSSDAFSDGGPETIIFQVRLFSNISPVVATANTVTVADTSFLSAPTSIEYLVIAGGGGGGGKRGGGGGGGGFRTGTMPGIVGNTTYTVVVGGGGGGGGGYSSGSQGGSSSLSGPGVTTIQSIGGGGGGAYGGGGSGGSGGGGGSSDGTNGSGGAGTAGQGNNGGSAPNGYGGAGGGGAGGAGGNQSGGGGGSGGPGATSAISGVSTFYAGGGGGGEQYTGDPGGGGGAGGGTAGGDGNAGSSPANTGGGAGGGGDSPSYSGGSGGSGIVILRHLTSSANATLTSGTYSTSGGYRIYTFTTSGTIRFDV